MTDNTDAATGRATNLSLLSGTFSGRGALLLLGGREPRPRLLVHRIAARHLLENGPDDRTVLFVCADNAFHPEILVRHAKEHRRNPADVLSRIRLSRTFTIHQFFVAITERLEEALVTFRGSLVILSGIVPLFADGAVSAKEASALLERVMKHLKRLALRRAVPVLIPAAGGRNDFSGRPLSVLSCLRSHADLVLEIPEETPDAGSGS